MTEKTKEIIVEDSLDTVKLNKFFYKKYPLLSISNLQKLCRSGQIRVNSGRIKYNHTLNAGDKIRIPPFLGSLKEEMVKKVGISKELQTQILDSVIYQDNDIIVINKPSGISSQGGINVRVSLDKILKAALKKDVYLVHRLDKDTSGVMIFALNQKTANQLSQNFKCREVEKTYIALASNTPRIAKGTINLSIITDNKEKMIVDPKKTKEALTLYKVLKRYRNNTCLIECKPKTGRKHQIRAHLAYALNCPIVGDELYGGKVEDKSKSFVHLFAYELKIPEYGIFSATFPNWINLK